MAGQPHDFSSRCIGVPDNGLGFYVLVPERLDDAIQVFTASLNFRRGRLVTVDLTCNTLFNVKQVDFGLMGPGKRDGMRQRGSIPIRVIERDHDPLVCRRFQSRGHICRHQGGTASTTATPSRRQEWLQRDPKQQ